MKFNPATGARELKAEPEPFVSVVRSKTYTVAMRAKRWVASASNYVQFYTFLAFRDRESSIGLFRSRGLM
jgi:hypothetical protein